MIDDVSMTWFRLRERRASLRSRSRLADSAGRRQTFAAAMQQFEEQFAAAKVVTAYTRPLNLYYGLAQAGMAIAAAHAPDPWSFSRHGLTLTDRSGEVATMMVKPEGEGGFQKIAATTGSPVIFGPVSLGALWASLPSLQVGTLPGPEFPACLGLASNETNGGPPQATVFFDADMPEGDQAAWMKRFGEMMAACPTAAGWGIPMQPPPPGRCPRPPARNRPRTARAVLATGPCRPGTPVRSAGPPPSCGLGVPGQFPASCGAGNCPGRSRGAVCGRGQGSRRGTFLMTACRRRRRSSAGPRARQAPGASGRCR
jgi:hypothetical protein